MAEPTSSAPPDGPPRSAAGLLTDTSRLLALATAAASGSDALTHALKPGAELGHYLLLRRIAQGSMGVVFEALDRNLQRRVALKLLRTDQGVSTEDLARFRIESTAAARLRHPNIVPVYDVGVHDGVDYYTMELVEGTTFDAWMRGDNRTFRQRATIIEQVARAIHHAHENGVVHRDLKPANVMIDAQGQPHVTDFGLARTVDNESGVTMAGRTVGTPSFMSPEQAQGMPAGPRSDVWGLGAVLYDALTGRPPFVGESAYVVMTSVVSDDPIAPRRFDRAIPPELEAISLQCLEKDPEGRYVTAADLADDIKRWLDGEPVHARRVSPLKRNLKRLRKHRLPVALGLAAALVALTFAVYAAIELKLARADWITVYHGEFHAPADLDGLTFWDGRMEHEQPPWQVSQDGMLMRDPDWAWLKDVRIGGDVRVTATVAFVEPDAIELCLGSRFERIPFAFWVPAGYSCQFAGYRGTVDFISRNPEPRIAGVNSAIASAWRAAPTQTVTLLKRGERLELWVDGRLVQVDEDPLPLTGRGLDRIGVRTFAHRARLLSLSVERLALPEKSSPLVAGDALVEIGAFADAVERYRMIAHEHPGTPLAESALTRAYFSALRDPSGDAAAATVRAELDRDFPDCRYRGRLIELDALHAWQHRDYGEAVELLPRAFQLDPGSRAALRLVGAGPPASLDDRSAGELLRWIGATRGVRDLDLSSFGLPTLAGLEPLRPTSFVCSLNHIDSLAPLRGLPLETLRFDYNRVADLSPLAGMPVTTLTANNNAITDLAPLASCPALATLDIGFNQVRSLEPLARLPLTALGCSWNPIASLAPLAQTKLTYLGIYDCGIVDLSPLESTPLQSLVAGINRISDLRPLAHSQLTNLDVCCNLVSDLSPLAHTRIRDLTVSCNQISDLMPLRGLPLRDLDITENQVADLSPLAGMNLRMLRCGGNPLTSLDPFIASPPQIFLYDSGTMPLSEIARARDAWAADGKHQELARQAQALIDLRHGDVAALRRAATIFRGHSYLFMPLLVTWEEASARCQTLGGHLLSCGDADEQAMAAKMSAAVMWNGLRVTDAGASWDSGEPMTYQAFVANQMLRMRGPVRMGGTDANWFVRENPRDRHPFIIEWDSAPPP
jgi:hypothetical protein